MNQVNGLVIAALKETLNLDDICNINKDNRLKEDLGLDSMSSLTFLMKLEEKIEGFYVDPETLNNNDLLTIESISNYIKHQVKQ